MHRAMTRLAQTMAVLGSLVLVFLILMTCVSVTGRELNSFFNADLMQTAAPGLAGFMLGLGVAPITGDFELIENGMAFAIFAFLPLAQMHAAHATVDVFTQRLPDPLLRWMRALTEAVFALVLLVFAARLFDGMQAKMRYNETTYLIQFPVWWAYALALSAAVVAALVGVYMAGLRLAEALTGTDLVPATEGGDG